MRIKLFLVAAIVSSVVVMPESYAAVKSGSACPKVGSTAILGSKTFTCMKSGKKLIWNKGVALSKTMDKSSTPVSSQTSVTDKFKANGCHARVSAYLQVFEANMWRDLIAADGWEQVSSCPSTNPYVPFVNTTLKVGDEIRWRIFAPGSWEWFSDSEKIVSKFVPATTCQLVGQDGNSAMNVGFPKRANRLTSNGVINAVVIPVDFSDVPGIGKPSDEYNEMTLGMDAFYKAISGGRVSFKFTILDKYIRVPSKSDHYGLGKWSGGDSGGYMKELISASDPLVDFSKFDVAYFLSPKSIPWSSIAYGPAFPNDLKTQDGILRNASFSGADAYQNFPGAGWKWISHETGHLFGLHDLYTVDPQPATYGSWDLMSNNWSTAAIEINAWNRYIQGWLEDNQINCLDKSKSNNETITINPIARINKLTKAIVVKISDSKVVVIESRRSEGFDVLSPAQAGTLVYTVDMKIGSIKGGWETQRRPGSTAKDFTDAALKVGDKIVVEGVSIEVISQNTEGDKVKVSF